MVNRNSSQAVRLNELDSVLLRTKSALLVSIFSHNVKLSSLSKMQPYNAMNTVHIIRSDLGTLVR